MNIDSVHGEMAIEDGVGIVVVSSVYPTTPDDLWQAVTSITRLRRWFGELTPHAGATTSFDAALTTGWSGMISVTRCEAPTHLTAELRDDDATTTVTAHLEPTDDGTRLTIEERGLEPVGLHIYVAGWHAQLDQLEATIRRGSDVAWRPRWEQLRDLYSAEAVR